MEEKGKGKTMKIKNLELFRTMFAAKLGDEYNEPSQ